MIERVKEFTDCNILDCWIGTTGECGGDAGHGGHTYIKLENPGGTAWKATIDGKEYDDPKSIRIDVYGDAELRTLAKALKFAAKKLEKVLKI